MRSPPSGQSSRLREELPPKDMDWRRTLSVHSMRRSPLFRPAVRLALVALAATTLSAITGQAPASAAAGCVSPADCLSKMTLAEKAGQMTQVANSYIRNKTDITTYGIGSILSGGGGGPNGAGRKATQWAGMVDGFQGYALRSRPGSPMLYGGATR